MPEKSKRNLPTTKVYGDNKKKQQQREKNQSDACQQTQPN